MPQKFKLMNIVKQKILEGINIESAIQRSFCHHLHWAFIIYTQKTFFCLCFYIVHSDARKILRSQGFFCSNFINYIHRYLGIIKIKLNCLKEESNVTHNYPFIIIMSITIQLKKCNESFLQINTTTYFTVIGFWLNIFEFIANQ